MVLGELGVRSRTQIVPRARILAVAVLMLLLGTLGVRHEFVLLTAYAAIAPNAFLLVLPLIAVQLPPLTNAIVLIPSAIPPQLSSAVPSIVMILLLAIARLRIRTLEAVAIAASIAVSWATYGSGAIPFYQSMLCASVGVWYVWHWTEQPGLTRVGVTAIGTSVVSGLLLVGYGVAWKSEPVFWLPEKIDVLESRHFKNYAEVLAVSGIRGKVIRQARDIPPNSTVVVPYSFGGQLGAFLESVRDLDHANSLRIVIFGEHTNSGELSSAVQRSSQIVGFNRDTTVPHLNRDSLGHVSIAGSIALQNRLPLNRGASISIHHISGVPLIASYTAHAEEEYSSDGRLGDYVFRPGKRAGPIVFGAASIGAPSWVLFGDNTPALAEIVVQSPRYFVHLLELSTLKPALAYALILLALVPFIYAVHSVKIVVHRLLIGLVAIAVAGAGFTLEGSAQGDFYRPEAALIARSDRYIFGELSDGRALVSLAPILLRKNARLEFGDVLPRVGEQYQGKVRIGEPILSKDARDIHYNECVRVGGIAIGSLRVMDGKACPMVAAVPMIGSQGDAVAYRSSEFPRTVVIMDKHFLSNASLEANSDWIRDQVLSGLSDR